MRRASDASEEECTKKVEGRQGGGGGDGATRSLRHWRGWRVELGCVCDGTADGATDAEPARLGMVRFSGEAQEACASDMYACRSVRPSALSCV